MEIAGQIINKNNYQEPGKACEWGSGLLPVQVSNLNIFPP